MLHWIILGIYVAVTIGTMVVILLDNRQPVKTMAWLLVLWFVPVVGLVLYYFLGRNTRKERLISQRSMDQLTKRSMMEYSGQRGLRIPQTHRFLIDLFTNLGLSFPFKDNKTDIYTTGSDFFLALLQDIGNATGHIHIDIFIIEDDPLGRLIADALIDKARQGVEVRLIYDDVGCWRVKPAFFERMREAGIDVHSFMPVKLPVFTSKLNYRNHRKLIVIDGRIGYIGGMNIALRYVKGTGRQPWRDTMLRLQGGGVYGIQRAFLVDWYFVDRTLITNRRYYPQPDGSISDAELCQIVTSSPISPWPDIEQGFMRIIMQAREYVYIETPYFLPTEPILFALRTAALAGVDVRIMLPRYGDSRIVDWASRGYLPEVLDAGVTICFYDAGFNHSKLMVSDDLVSTCGSTNLDFRSLGDNFESNAFFYGRRMALRLKQVFLDDQKHCEMVLDSYFFNHRPFLKRLGESLLRLLAPLM